MGAVYFYHLTQHPLETTLPVLLQKAVAAGWRTEVRGTDAARMAWLDERLWVQQTDGFLPHALESEAEASESPVVLSTEPVDNVRCKIDRRWRLGERGRGAGLRARLCLI